jgi:hypothetical protein
MGESYASPLSLPQERNTPKAAIRICKDKAKNPKAQFAIKTGKPIMFGYEQTKGNQLMRIALNSMVTK